MMLKGASIPKSAPASLRKLPLHDLSEDHQEWYGKLVLAGLQRPENAAAVADLCCKDSLALVVAPSSLDSAQKKRFDAVLVSPDASVAWGVARRTAVLEQLKPRSSWRLEGPMQNVSLCEALNGMFLDNCCKRSSRCSCKTA
jgi:hypothetical protein